jgi:dihydroorotase
MDLILRGGRVIDPAQALDGIRDVGFANGRVAAVAPRIAEPAKEECDVAGAIVTPGMIDLHTHVYWGGTSIGVEAEPIARRSGTTTFVDAGTAGPANFPGFRRHVIERSAVRILAYLNVSFAGIFAFSRSVMVGEASDLRLLDLNDKICKWPLGHPGEPDFHFCGDKVNPGFPYCVAHCGHAYQAQLPRRDRRPPPPLPFGGPRVR